IIARTVVAPYAAAVARGGGVVGADDLAVAPRPPRPRIRAYVIERELPVVGIPHAAIERHADPGAPASASHAYPPPAAPTVGASASAAHHRHVELIVAAAELRTGRDTAAALTRRRKPGIADGVPEMRGERAGRRIRVPIVCHAVGANQALLRRGAGGRLRREHG